MGRRDENEEDRAGEERRERTEDKRSVLRCRKAVKRN